MNEELRNTVIFFSKKTKKISKRPRQREPSLKPTSADVFSYHSKRSTSKTQAPKKVNRLDRRRNIWHRTLAAIVFLAIIISAGYVLSLNSNVRVVSLNSVDNLLFRNLEDYQKVAQKLLNNSITAKTKLTINKENFVRAMKQQFPELIDVSVRLPLVGHRPIVEITSARPVLLLNNQNNQIFALDNRGRVILSGTDLSKLADRNLLTIFDQSSSSVSLGKNILSQQDASFILEIIAQLQSKDIKISTLSLPAVANELHIKLADQPYIIKFNTQTNARQAIGTFFAVKHKLETDHTLPAEYIDVRIEEKAYYK